MASRGICCWLAFVFGSLRFTSATPLTHAEQQLLYTECDLTTSTYIKSEVVTANLTYLHSGQLTRPFEEVDLSREFHCDLEHDDCGITNQNNMQSFFRLTVTNLGGKNTSSFVMSKNSMESVGGRLITPYFVIGKAHAVCLSFDYYLTGQGARKIEVHSQDVRNCILARIPNNLLDTQPKWKTQMFSLLAMGDVRFFIEAHTEPGKAGSVAIDNINFVHRKCCKEKECGDDVQNTVI